MPLSDVICVRHTLPADAANQPACRPSLTIHYARRQRLSASISAPLSNCWRIQRRRFQHTDPRIVRLWLDTIERHLSAAVQRPRHLLVFVNPFGGRQNALRIYEKWARPVFELAGVEADVVVSQRPNQIADMLQRHLLAGLDGVCCVGGDGTVSEVFNGLVRRAMVEEAETEQGQEVVGGFPRPRLPVGIIPGGSTDTIAYCLHGTTDVQTAVIHIVLGQRTGLDMSSVRRAGSGELLRLYASVMSYGYLGDVAADSERFRWMGPSRYDYSGFKKFVMNRGYEGEIHIEEGVGEEEVDGEGQHGPDDGVLCCEQCPRCTTAAQQESVIRNGTKATAARWRVLRGKFFMVNGANLSCACERSPNGFSRYGHVGDGRLDLVLVRHTPMLNNLRLLQKLASRKQCIVSELYLLFLVCSSLSLSLSLLPIGGAAFCRDLSRASLSLSTGHQQQRRRRLLFAGGPDGRGGLQQRCRAECVHRAGAEW